LIVHAGGTVEQLASGGLLGIMSDPFSRRRNFIRLPVIYSDGFGSREPQRRRVGPPDSTKWSRNWTLPPVESATGSNPADEILPFRPPMTHTLVICKRAEASDVATAAGEIIQLLRRMSNEPT
jgi:hypothetical protein